MKSRFFIFLKQIVIILAVVAVVGYWQARDLPDGFAPHFKARSMEGSVQEFPDASQTHVTLIYFFAPWCGVCRLSMGNLDHLKNWLPNTSVVAVALDYESDEQVVRFIKEVDVGVPVFLGDESVRNLWQINAYPTYVVIGSDQTIHGASIGYSSQFGMILRVLWTKLVT